MLNRNLVKFLSFRYVILAIVFIMVAGGLVLLPKYQKHEGISPEDLLAKAISPERYITTDELADRIINQDPSLLLIDVRDENCFEKYTLPNAVNIPLSTILDEDSEPYLDQDQYDVILFSNNNFYSDQAWILCNRLNYNNLHVLKGGVNYWFNTIINPKKPTENMASSEFELYSFRKAASMYFGVAYPEDIKISIKPMVVPDKEAKKIITVKKRKKMPVEGGC